MKLRFALSVVLLAICINIFGQQQKSVPTQKQQIEELTTTVSNQQEAISQLQAENKELLKQLGKMEQDIDIYREDVRNKSMEVDNKLSHALTLLSIIVGFFGIIIGFVSPSVLINSFKRNVYLLLGDAKLQAKHAEEVAKKAEVFATEVENEVDNITGQMVKVTKQVEDATTLAKEAKQAVIEVKKQRQEVKTMQSQIKEESAAAQKAARNAKAIQLFAEAINEKDISKSIKLYDQAI